MKKENNKLKENNNNSDDKPAVYWAYFSDYIRDVSTKARNVGRSIVFSIIAASWTLCYRDQVFTPSSLIKWSLIFALIYLFCDLLYYIIMTSVYKYIMLHYFKHLQNGDVKFKNGKNSNICDIVARRWSNFGIVWLIIMSLLLLTASILMILHVIQIVAINNV